MTRGDRIAIRVFAVALTAVLQSPAIGPAQDRLPQAADRAAVAYLAAEVPKWVKENACYSCHNNGDAARALIAAVKSGDLKDRRPLDDTLAFLASPERWDANGPEGPFKDKKLARIQFGAVLAAAHTSGVMSKPGALEQAARLVGELQRDDGSWETDAPGTLGSPVTYGRTLATVMSTRVLIAADRAAHRRAIAAAHDWLETNDVKSVLDAAATLWALADRGTPRARHQRERCLQLIRQGESADGGWGPFVNSPREVFDTALVLVALADQKERLGLGPLIARGQAYLVASQAADGSWPATTRPAGVDSYAQQLSTTGWATQALLATREKVVTNGVINDDAQRNRRYGRCVRYARAR